MSIGDRAVKASAPRSTSSSCSRYNFADDRPRRPSFSQLLKPAWIVSVLLSLRCQPLQVKAWQST